jgi:hypothetical protein
MIRLIQNVPASPIHSIYNKTMLHGDFIPDDEAGLFYQLCLISALFDETYRMFVYWNGNSKHGVGSATSNEDERCNP